MVYFDSPAWKEAVCSSYGYSLDKGFAFVKSMLFGDRWIAFPFSDYVTVGDADPLTREAWEIRTKVPRPATWLKAEYSDFRLEGTPNQIWQRLDRKLRNQLRAATTRSDLWIERVGPENLRRFYAFYLTVQTARGSPTHSMTFFERASRAGMELSMAGLGDRIASAIGIGLAEGEASWWLNANASDLRSLNATALLLWTWINTHPETPLELGRSKYGSGTFRYKKQWGGSEFKISTYGTKKPVEAGGYPLASVVWSRLPSPIPEYLGPRIIGGLAL